jgi:hypothetical protein
MDGTGFLLFAYGGTAGLRRVEGRGERQWAGRTEQRAAVPCVTPNECYFGSGTPAPTCVLPFARYEQRTKQLPVWRSPTASQGGSRRDDLKDKSDSTPVITTSRN